MVTVRHFTDELSEQSAHSSLDQPSDDKDDREDNTWQHETSVA